jgi:hypothetical protein
MDSIMYVNLARTNVNCYGIDKLLSKIYEILKKKKLMKVKNQPTSPKNILY